LPHEYIQDHLMGTGTTGAYCRRKGIKFYGIELSKDQCDYSIERIRKEIGDEGLL